MKLRFLSVALDELRQAAEFYESKDRGLGLKFLEEVEESLARVVRNPNAWALLSARTRRCRTRHFPYGIIYQVREDEILVVSVMNLYKYPESWKRNL
ncbi:MAG: type II toxin-antitoxin system RelE/ParE family toxin [Acidobacteriota bacterium]